MWMVVLARSNQVLLHSVPISVFFLSLLLFLVYPSEGTSETDERSASSSSKMLGCVSVLVIVSRDIS